MAQAIVTGGSGFIGGHLLQHLLQGEQFDTIINLDYKAPSLQSSDGHRLHYIKADVREPLDPEPFKALGCGEETVIFNLAAICKIPGYPTVDYFRTNIRGAETVTKLADALGCTTMIFMSSIAPYGGSEELKTEESVPQPDNAYGSSKLVAEYIHRCWQEKKPDQRKLVILRPGIVFGKNEQANFSRLYHSLKQGFFVYPGRKDSRKACVYVKDVARACSHFADTSDEYALYNLVYPETPSIEAICTSISTHTDAKSARFTVPGSVLKGAAHLINAAGKISGNNFSGIHPDRVRKVMVSTNISGRKLEGSSFDLRYSLDDGIEEWYKECGGALY
jgi:nucleoside-diphosphate-sugar epimerase